MIEGLQKLGPGYKYHGHVKYVFKKEVIIFSCVRSNSEGNIGFLKDRRRLNVAITRPKRGLIITGNPTTLKHDPVWASWIDWIEESGLMAWHIS